MLMPGDELVAEPHLPAHPARPSFAVVEVEAPHALVLRSTTHLPPT
jgi:hypothetical protein